MRFFKHMSRVKVDVMHYSFIKARARLEISQDLKELLVVPIDVKKKKEENKITHIL